MPIINNGNGTLVLPVLSSSVGANKYHLGLFVSASASYPVEVSRVVVVPRLTAAITGTLVNVILKRITANGTPSASATIRKFNSRSGSIPSSLVGTSAWSANPTEDSNPELAEQAINNEETVAQSPRSLFESAPDRGISPITLWPGQGLVIQQGALAGAGAISAYIYFRIRKG